MNITHELLSKVSDNGKYLVVRLKQDHLQEDCTTVPAGTIGVIKVSRARDKNVFVFPKDVLAEDSGFSDGHVRIVDLDRCDILGRVG